MTPQELQQAANYLTHEAESLWRSFRNRAGTWDDAPVWAKAKHEELIDLAAKLRRLARKGKT